MTRPLISAIAAVTAGLFLAGCATTSAGGPASTSTTPGHDGAYPVTVTSCDQKLTFDKAPTRAVTSDINMFEDMVALGLEAHVVGTFALKGYGDDGSSPVPGRDQAAYAEVPVISDSYLALEPLVAARPDFLFAGWNYGLKVGGALTPENLTQYGITTYVLQESCAHVEGEKRSVSIEDTYADLTNLGAIFGVPEKAREVIAAMKAKVAAVQAKVAGEPARKVFVYDSGTDAPFTAPGLAMPDALISLAGGVNTMHGLAQTWTSVSWEQAVASRPDCIIVNDYGTPTYDQKVQFLTTSPQTKDLPAVRNGCFIRLDYAQLTPGPSNADAVEAIARALYPHEF